MNQRPDSGAKSPSLRLRLRPAAETAIRAGHPWVFDESISDQNRTGYVGELAIIFDKKDRFLAIGLYDPDSPLRVRILHAGNPQKIEQNWWVANLKRALKKRTSVADALTNGYRCINGESDHWPGLVLDQYGTTFVLKLYTLAWLPRLPEILELFIHELSPERIVLRLSRNIQAAASAQFSKEDGQILCGPRLDRPVVFLESGLRFEAEVLKGQKTGFFLDQRENRRRVEQLSQNGVVLNTFSFSGGFSLYAARGGARSVTDVDISKHALDSAQRNFALNASVPSVAQCQRFAEQADVFEWLEGNADKQYDIVILDPPSLARKESERAGALKAYGRLASLGLKHLKAGGVLVACSCSAHVQAKDFFETVRTTLKNSGQELQEFATTFHPPDHPATFPEAEYLKTIYFRHRR